MCLEKFFLKVLAWCKSKWKAITGVSATAAVVTGVLIVFAISSFPALDPNDTNNEGDKWWKYTETLSDAMLNEVNVTLVVYNGSQPLTFFPWFGSSSSCKVSDLRSGSNCQIGGARSLTPSSLNFCVVTDEQSQGCLIVAASNSSGNDAMMMGCINVIGVTATTSYGVGTRWRWGVKNESGTLNIIKNISDDTASDAEARNIQALVLAKNNTAFNSTVRQAASVLLDSYCPDFLGDNFVYFPTAKTGTYNSSRQWNYHPTTGGNSAAAGIDSGSSYFVGYTDNCVALYGCYVHTNSSAYLNAANDCLDVHLEAAQWNSTTGFRYPDGRQGTWTDTSTPVYTCQQACTTAQQNDTADRIRDSVCVVGYLGDISNTTVHPEIWEYCQEKSAAVATACGPTEASRYIYHNGTVFNCEDAYESNGPASYIDLWANTSNLATRHNTIDSKFQEGTQTFNSVSCIGLYSTAFAVTGANLAIGRWDDAYNISSQISVEENVSANTTLYWSCDFETTGCGFDIAPQGGYLNVSSTTMNTDLNMSAFNYSHFSFMAYLQNNSLGAKFAPQTGNGHVWIWGGTGPFNLQIEPNYSTTLSNFPLSTWTEVNITNNHSANNSRICFGGSCAQAAGTFTFNTSSNDIQFTTTYSGADLLIDNMSLYVLPDEIPVYTALPTVSIDSPSNGTSTTNTSIVLTFTAVNYFNSSVPYVVFINDSANATGSASNDTGTQVSLTNLEVGPYTLTVQVTDAADRAVNSSSLYITIQDPAAPDFPLAREGYAECKAGGCYLLNGTLIPVHPTQPVDQYICSLSACAVVS